MKSLCIHQRQHYEASERIDPHAHPCSLKPPTKLIIRHDLQLCQREHFQLFRVNEIQHLISTVIIVIITRDLYLCQKFMAKLTGYVTTSLQVIQVWWGKWCFLLLSSQNYCYFKGKNILTWKMTQVIAQHRLCGSQVAGSMSAMHCCQVLPGRQRLRRFLLIQNAAKKETNPYSTGGPVLHWQFSDQGPCAGMVDHTEPRCNSQNKIGQHLKHSRSKRSKQKLNETSSVTK